METLKNNWLLLAGAFLAWRWYIANKAQVPLTFALLHPFEADPYVLLTLRNATKTQPEIVVPLPNGASVTIEGEIVKIL